MPMNPQDQYTYRAVNNIIRITGCDKSKFDDILDQVCEAMYFAGSKAVCDSVGEMAVMLGQLLERVNQLLQVAREDQERRIAELPPEPKRDPDQSQGVWI